MAARPTLGFSVCHAPGKPNVLIKDIEADGPAEKAGLRAGDEIISIDGTPIPNMGSFKSTTKSLTIGQQLSIRIWRSLPNENSPVLMACKVTVGRRKSVDDLRSPESPQKLGKTDVDKAFGKFFSKESSPNGPVPGMAGQAPNLEVAAEAQPPARRRSLHAKLSGLFR